MDRNDNFQSADEVTKLGGLPRRDRLSTENLELDVSSQLDQSEYVNSKTRKSDFYEQNTGTDIIKPYSEPDLCTKTLLVDYDVAGHTNKHLFIRETQGDKFCVMSGDSKTNTNLPNTSKFTEYVLNNEFINTAEDKENLSHNTQRYSFDLSEDSVPCNRTVIPNQNIVKLDINNVIPTKSKTATIKSLSKTASHDCSLNPDNSFLTLEKHINKLPSTTTDLQSNMNMIMLGNNKEQTPCKNMEFNALETKELNEISKQTIKKPYPIIDTISMQSKLTTFRVQSLTSLAAKALGNLKSYRIPNQNIDKYSSDFGEISMECGQMTSNIKTGYRLVSVAHSEDVKYIIHITDSSSGTGSEIKQLFGSPSSSESSNAYDNSLEYIEHKLNYKPKNKGIDKLQICNEKLYQESLAMRESIGETEFQLTGLSNKQYYIPSLDTLLEESNFKISNINTVTSSESEDVSPYHDPVYTVYNDSPMTKSQVKEICDRPENLKSNEIFNQNIATYHSDFGKTSMQCKQIPPNIKTELNMASDTISPMNYKPKNIGHKKQIKDKNTGLDLFERKDTVGGTHLNKQYDANFHIKLNTNNFSSASSTESMSTDCEAVLKDNIFLPLENQLEKVTVSQGNPKLNEMLNQNNKKCSPNFVKSSTPKIKISSPNVLKKSPATSVKKTPNKSNEYHYIQSPVAAYIHHSPQVPLVKDVYPKKQLPRTSRKLQEVTGSEAIKSSNKENINLPLVAYKSTEETKVMEIPDKNELPKCLRAKQMTSSPQPE